MDSKPEGAPLYRYVTTENIRAGDIILEEEAWIWSFLPSYTSDAESPSRLVCNFCFQKQPKLLSCSACKSTFYCNAQCQRADWHARHKHGDCANLKAVRHLPGQIPGGDLLNNFQEAGYKALTRRLIFSVASARLLAAKELDKTRGASESTLWRTFTGIPLTNLDWFKNLDLDHPILHFHPLISDVNKLVKVRDLPDNFIEKRLLLSLVQMRDNEPWKKELKSDLSQMYINAMPEQLGLGSCLEMSRFPQHCNPNAVVMNEGRLVRMIALEDIPNLDAVRLSRMLGWKHQTRHSRRSGVFRGVFGYDCFCARCNAGNSADPLLFALRCPKWSERYDAETHSIRKNDDDEEAPCDGIVSGLRRTDADPIDIGLLKVQFGAVYAATIDEPRPLSEDDEKMPAHERAVCPKCNARYDQPTMNGKILDCLKYMESLNRRIESFHVHAQVASDYCLKQMVVAEQYVHPDNYLFMLAKQMLMSRSLVSIAPGSPLDAPAAAWVKRYALESLERVKCKDYERIDVLYLYGVVLVYVYYVVSISQPDDRPNRPEAERNVTGHRLYELIIKNAGIDMETNEYLSRGACVAAKKLKMLLQVLPELPEDSQADDDVDSVDITEAQADLKGS